jgi:hypothetical protein
MKSRLGTGKLPTFFYSVFANLLKNRFKYLLIIWDAFNYRRCCEPFYAAFIVSDL